MNTSRMKVSRTDDQGDRVLVYGNRDDYHVICPKGTQVKPGETIMFEPYGVNFGFMVTEKETP